MEFAILIYESPGEFTARTDPARAQSYWGAYAAYRETLERAGVLRGGQGLEPVHAATTVRLERGKRHVQDGPFADTKEQLGGFFVIEAPDLDSALDWAARCPAAASGAVELRPILPMCAPTVAATA